MIYNTNHRLEINSLGMIYSRNDDIELSVDDFLKSIDSDINLYQVKKDILSNHFVIKYASSVHKDEKGYVIHLKSHSGNYRLNADSYPELAKKLDKYCEITEKHDAQKENYDKLYSDEKNEKIDYKGALSYLKMARKSNRKYLTFLLSMLTAGVLSLALATRLLIHVLPALTVNSFSWIATLLGCSALIAIPTVTLATNLVDNPHDNLFTKIVETLGFDRYLGLQSKRVEEKVNSAKKSKKVYNSEMSETYQPKDVYSDAVIEYISNIKNAAIKLDKDDRDAILTELMEVLNDYTKKCKKLNDGGNKGLTLEGDKRVIMTEAIDKLTDLQFRVAEIMKGNGKNKTLIMESDKLMNELQELTAIDTKEERRVVARGSR